MFPNQEDFGQKTIVATNMWSVKVVISYLDI
jgi:hypothetical protein